MCFFCSLALCCAPVIALLIVLSDSPCERKKKIGTLSDIERRQIVVALLVGASAISTCTLLGV
jgi:hypothetical protein